MERFDGCLVMVYLNFRIVDRFGDCQVVMVLFNSGMATKKYKWCLFLATTKWLGYMKLNGVNQDTRSYF